MEKLPPPDCELGYTDSQLDEILGDRRYEFNRWMVGQTSAICDGRRYRYDLNKYIPTDCGPHGRVVYPWDMKRFLDGRPIVD